MIGRSCPASINAPIWISSSRLGSTTNQAKRTSCAFATAAGGGGLTIETSTPPGLITCQECCKVSPPTISTTKYLLGVSSQFWYGPAEADVPCGPTPRRL